MKDERKTKKQLINELAEMRQRVAELEASETERKRAEKALRESGERYRSLFDGVPMGLYRTTPEGQILDANPALVQMLGYPDRESLLAVNAADIYVNPEDRQQEQTVLEQEGLVRDFEMQLRRRDGTVIWVRDTAGAVWDAEGQVLHYEGSLEDITARKRAEKELWESRELFEKAFVNQRDAILLLDARTPPTILDCNPATRDVFGYTRPEMQGRTMAWLHVNETTLKEVQELLCTAMEEYGFLHLPEFEMKREDGTVFPAELSVAPLKDKQGQHTGWVYVVRDITARKRAEKALAEQRQLLETILKQAADAIVVCDDRGKLTFVNAAARRLALLDPENTTLDIAPTVWGEAYDEDGQPIPIEERSLPKALRGDVTVGRQARMVCPDGSYYDILISSAPLRSPDHRIIGAVATFSDITKHKQAEEVLRESEEKYRSLVENSTVGVAIVQGLEMKFVNQALLKTLGCQSEDEMVGRKFTDFVSPEYRNLMVERGRAREEGEHAPSRYEFKALRKDGTEFDAELSVSRIAYQGSVARQGIIRDITERKRAEEALKRRAAQLALLNDIGGKIAAVLELDSVLDRAARLVQENFGYHHVALFTLDRERGGLVMRARAGAFTDLFPPDHRLKLDQGIVGWVGRHCQTLLANDVDAEPRYVNLYPNVIPTRSELSVPIRVDKKVVGALDVQSPQLNAFDENDVMVMETLADQIAVAIENARLYQAVQRELAERKQLEALLRQAQKMECLGSLAAGIAHDFNNLLNPIGGFTELLLQKAPEGSQQQGYLRHIRAAAERAAALTRQLRLFTRQEEGKRHPIQLNSVVEETRDLLEHSIPKGITIELRLASELWAVEADPSQISQVLMNLCVNARDAMPDGGTLTLETRNVTLDEEYARTVLEAQPGRYACLSVSDTGCGMSPEVQARLFEPFFTTKEMGEGTGLGLSVVYGIVKGHDGFINFYSEEGQGSTFHIYLPAIELAVEEREVEGLEPPTGTETILLVDDEEMVLELGQGVLDGSSYTVLTAKSGVQALEMYQAHRREIALVVLDAIMPEMGGRECLRRLRELDPRVKVLISTGYLAKDLAQELVAEGALGVVEKLLLLQDFATVVRTALDQSEVIIQESHASNK